MLNQYLDRFINPYYCSDNATLYRVRLLVGILLGVSASCMAMLLFFFVSPQLPTSAVIANTAIILPCIGCWLVCVYLLKNTQQFFTIITHVTIGSTIVALLLGIAITGGPAETEVHPILSVPAIIGFLIAGKEAGLRWTAFIACSYLCLILLQVTGVTFMNLPPAEFQPILKIFNWTYSFVIIAALAYLYETLSSAAKYDRDQKENDYKEIAATITHSALLHNTTQSLSDSSERLFNSTISQKAAIEDLATTSEELMASSQDNQAHAETSLTSIQEVNQLLLINQANNLQLTEAMNLIKSSSQEIQQINDVINEIAQQTNLLSLNAMIEASRFDEAESGFTVVANEVKRLAERSVEAVDSINKLLKQNTSAVEEGFTLSKTLQAQASDIEERISPLVNINQQVAESCREQYISIQQINGGLGEIDLTIETNKQLAAEFNLTADDLQNETSKLQHLSEKLGLISQEDNNTLDIITNNSVSFDSNSTKQASDIPTLIPSTAPLDSYRTSELDLILSETEES